MFRKMCIGTKLMVAFVTIALISGIGGIVSTVLLRSITDQYSVTLTDYGFIQGNIGIVMTELADSRRCVSDILHSTDSRTTEDLQKQMAAGQEKALALLADVGATMKTPEEVRLYKNTQALITEYVSARDAVIETSLKSGPGRIQRSKEQRAETLDPAYNALYENIQQLMSLKVTSGSSIATSLDQGVNLSLALTTFLLLFALVLSILLGIKISRGIFIPIKQCASRLEALAQGDLQSEVPVMKNQDETSILANSTRIIVEGLREIIEDETRLLGALAIGDLTVDAQANYPGDFVPLQSSIHQISKSLTSIVSMIRDSAEQVSLGSEHISAGAQDSSANAEEQAGSLEELAATIFEVNEHVTENARSAAQVNTSVGLVSQKLFDSNQQMEQLTNAMSEISRTSYQIQNVMKNIEEIALQTNILALNAAVEAAHAGSLGKGFAVVAEEVRSLASKSATASKNTAVLIENSIQAVESGSKLADFTAQSLLATMAGAKDVTDTIQKISVASAHQADALSLITTTVEQISSIVQTHSAASQQSAAASEELSGEAQILRSLVHQFKLV